MIKVLKSKRENKPIYIKGTISQKSYIKFRRQINNRLNRDKTSPIDITLYSEGGDAYAALAYFDFIRSLDVNVRINGEGIVASAAVLILAAGDKRTLTKSAWVMCHEDLPELEEARVTQLERDIAHSRRLENQWNDLLAFETKVDAKEWARIHKQETYLSAEECLKLGLIDEVI